MNESLKSSDVETGSIRYGFGVATSRAPTRPLAGGYPKRSWKMNARIIEACRQPTLNGSGAKIRGCNAAGCKLSGVKQNRLNIPVVKLRKAL
jgi:hypothetical protein